MDNILLAIDGSESCSKAIPKTAELAEKLDAKVTIMTVIENMVSKAAEVSPATDPQEIQDTRENLHQKGREIVSNCEEHMKNKGIETEIIVRRGKPSDLICEEAEEGYDVVVLSDKGEGTGGIKKILLGSTTERVVRHSSISVWVVK